MQKYLPVLRSCPFFTGLTDDEILSILHCVSAAKITRPRGSYIFHAGDSTEVMGLVLSGSTLVIQEDLWGRAGQHKSLDIRVAQVVETDTLHLMCYQKIWEMLTQKIGPNPLSLCTKSGHALGSGLAMPARILPW